MGLEWQSKNVGVVVVLVTLTLCALFTAMGTTNLIAGRMMPLQGGVIALTASAEGLTRPPGSDAPDVKEILKRNIFDSETGALWPPPPPETDEESPEDAPEKVTELLPGQMPPPCEGNLKMVASVYSEGNPEWSFATLTTGSEAPLLYRRGAEVDGKQVDSIYPQAVFMKDGPRLCSLTLFDLGAKQADPKNKNAPKPPTPAARKAPTPPAIPRAGGPSQDDLEKNISKVSDTSFKVNRSLVDNLLSNQAALMRSARVVPHEQNGQVVGVKLYGIRRKSVLGQLGLQNGDLLRTINGYDMSSPDSALEAYSRLRSASNLSVTITRRGRPMTVDYNIAE